MNEETLKQIAKMISSGEIPKEVYDKYLSNCPIGFMNEKELFNFLQQENQQLKEQIEELNFIIGIRQKRNLISKFDKEYDGEDKKKNSNRDYVVITPDAEEVYKRYYELKEQLKQKDEVIDELEKHIRSLSSKGRDCMIYSDVKKDILGILNKYKGVDD